MEVAGIIVAMVLLKIVLGVAAGPHPGWHGEQVSAGTMLLFFGSCAVLGAAALWWAGRKTPSETLPPRVIRIILGIGAGLLALGLYESLT